MAATGAESTRKRKGTAETLSRTRAVLHVSRALQVAPSRLWLLTRDNVIIESDGVRFPEFNAKRGLVTGQTVWCPAQASPELMPALEQWLTVSADVAPQLLFENLKRPVGTNALGARLSKAVETCAGNAGLPLERQQRPWTWTAEELDDVLERVDPCWREHRRAGAYMLIGLGLGLRDGSLRSIMRESIAPAGDFYKLEVPHYKFGNGELVRSVHHTEGHPPTCPACALERWLELRGVAPGPLFTSFDQHRATDRLVEQKTARRGLVALLQNAGLQGRWGTHSLRRGFVCAAVDAGMPAEWIQGVTYHRSIDEILRYFQEADLRALPSPLDAA